MPWVREHRRRTPYSLFGRTRVRSHYRRSPGHPGLIAAVVVVLVILVLIALF
jgi:hypothetical protein